MPRNRQIAILLPDTLQAVGLECILNEYFSPLTISRFTNYPDFTQKSAEMADFYFTNANYFLLHIDFFLPRRAKTIVLMQHTMDALPHSGAMNLIAEEVPLETLIEQIESFLSLADANSHSENNKGLSVREVNVLRLVVSGYTNKEIADQLSISLNTVLTHRKNITAKLGIKTVSGLTFYAIMNGYISGTDMSLDP